MTPEALAAALARSGSPGTGIPVLRYAGPVPPSGLRWMVHRPGREPVAMVRPVVISAALAAAERAGPAARYAADPAAHYAADHAAEHTADDAAAPAADHTDQSVVGHDETTATLQSLHAELGRELRRAATIGIGRTPRADAALVAADLDVVAALLEAPAALARGGRAANRHTAVLAAVLDAWLAEVAITPRTIDHPIGPHHETRCAVAAAARRLLAEMLAAKGVPAPERR